MTRFSNKWIGGVILFVMAQTGRAEFPPVYDTEKSEVVLPSSREVLASWDLPDGFQIELFASDPRVRQPIHITTDERGRLWVCENYTYAESGVRFAEDLRDRILILEDTDQDGVADKRTVFWDGAEKLTSVEVGFGGIWALCAPNFLFIPDKDGDDVPDGEPVVLLDGWEDDAVGHNIVNGLKWGPDGWLYGRHGIQATSVVGKPGSSESQRTALNCCIWRYHPTRHVFEVVAEGGTNSWGFDYDDHGQMFFINTVIGHLWHVVPGAKYKRMYGAHFNPYLYQLIQQCADHYHWDGTEKWTWVRDGLTEATSDAGGGHAHCGMMIYQGNNWPDKYRNTVFTVNLHGLRLNNDRLERSGSGYVGKHNPDLFFCSDPWFRGIELIWGPDGGVYLADWTDIGECHESDGVHRSSGRIFKLTYGAPDTKPDLDLASLTSSDLVQLQLDRNDWYCRTARKILQERAVRGDDLSQPREELLEIYESNSDVTRRLRALWCLYSMESVNEEWLIGELADPNEHIRAWAIRLLTDKGEPSSNIKAAFQVLGEKDPSSLVRLFLASSMQKLPFEERWPLAENLCAHAEDATDQNIPFMIWYGIVDAVPENPGHALALASDTAIPMVRENIVRRLAAEQSEDPELLENIVQLLNQTEETESREQILSGLQSGLAGFNRVEAPSAWDSWIERVEKTDDKSLIELTRSISILFGEGRALEDLMEIAKDGERDPKSRAEAIRFLAPTGEEEVGKLLLELVNDRALAVEAAKGLAYYDLPEVERTLMGRYKGLGPEYRKAAVGTLASRPSYAAHLMKAMKEGEVPARDVSAYVARQIVALGDNDLTREFEGVWGTVGKDQAETRSRIDEYKNRLREIESDHSDLVSGKKVFDQVCASCHVLFGEGKTIGPDLTGGQRDNLDYLLENILDPSAMVAEGFQMSTLFMRDERVLTGVILEETEKLLNLQTQEEELTIDRDEIEEIVPSKLSLMPEGLIQNLSDEELRDLFAYLRQ